MSETTNLKLFKHDNPATNENQFDVTKALNNNWDKLDKFAGTTNTKITENQNNIKSLQTDNITNKQDIATLKSDNTTNKQDIANLKTENEELKAENERLRQDMNAYPSNEASGEYITLTDSADSRFNKFRILGKSTQKTREGYNLFNYDSLKSTTRYGVTFTVNEDKSITANGTATQNSSFDLIGSVNNYPLNLRAGNYVLTGCDGGSVSSYYLEIYNGTRYYACTNDNIKFTFDTDTSIRCYFVFKEGATFNNFTFYPMLVAGTEKKEYEQYGAMPSPKFISPINNIEGSINLFDGELEKGSINYDSGLNEENENRTRSKNYIELPSNILKFKVIRTIVGNEFWIKFYDKDKKYLGYDSANGNYNKAQILQFNVLENTKYIRFVDLTNNLSNKIKITVDLLSYKYTEPNKGIIFIKNTCKNLINQDEIGNYNTYISYLSKTNEGYKTTSNFSNSRDCGTYLKLKKNTQYTVSLDIISITSEGIVRGEAEIMGHKPETDSNSFGTSLGVNSINSSHIGNRYKFTFNSGDYNFWTLHISGWYDSGFSGVLIYKNVQVEEGTEATEFKDGSQEFEFPLEEGQVLREGDYLADDGIHHKGTQVELDGTETILISTTLGNVTRFLINKKIEPNSYINRENQLCSHFSYLYKFNENVEHFYIEDNSGNVYVYINTTIASDVESFKSWLISQKEAGTPVTIETRLREETTTPYTDKQKQVYDEIVKTAKTYKTVTNIFSTNEISPKFEVEYRQDIKSLINNVSQAVLNNA